MTAGRSLSPVLRLVLALPLIAAALPATAQTAAQKATQQAVQQAASSRAVERCTAQARQQNIRLGKFESVQPAGPGVYEVRWARPFFGKPQLCRYELVRDAATFAGDGGLAALPPPVALDDKATQQEAVRACMQALVASGMTGSARNVTPSDAGHLEVEIVVGGEASESMRRCRYDVRRKSAAMLP